MHRDDQNKIQLFQNEWVIGLLLLTMVVLVRLPSIYQPLDNDGGANAYLARMILQGNPLYGMYHPAHHLPGVYYSYAAIFRLLGDNSAALKIFLLGWVWLNAWILYLTGKRVGGRLAGVLAAAFFTLVSSMTNLQGDSAQLEIFGNLPLTLVIWLGVIYLEKRSRPAAFILIGMAGAIGFIYKANFLASLVAVGAVLLLNALMEGNREAWVEMFQRGLAVLAGIGIVLLPITCYFIMEGLWARLLLVFQLGTLYVGLQEAQPAIYILLYPAVRLLVVNAALLIMGVVSTIRLLTSLPKTLSEDRTKGLIRILLVTWLLASIVEAGFSRLSYPHYTLLVIPPLSLLAALEISILQGQLSQAKSKSQWSRAWFPALLVVTIILNSGYTSRKYILGYFLYSSGQITYTEFIRDDTILGKARVESVEIAQYINSHTSMDQTIFVWSDQAEIYYLANRRSSSDVIWPVYVPIMGDPERVFKTRPAYIVLGSASFDVDPDPAWLAKELEKNYFLETTISDNTLYKRINP